MYTHGAGHNAFESVVSGLHENLAAKKAAVDNPFKETSWNRTVFHEMSDADNHNFAQNHRQKWWCDGQQDDAANKMSQRRKCQWTKLSGRHTGKKQSCMSQEMLTATTLHSGKTVVHEPSNADSHNFAQNCREIGFMPPLFLLPSTATNPRSTTR